MTKPSRFLIAATGSGCGKTTLTLGLLRCLRNRGLKVQPFKCGPDYIDTKFHDLASGALSVNLDTFLSSKRHVRNLLLKYGERKDVCIVEGVMGLFDGYDRMKGSSAEIATLTELPVILVINAKSVAYSVAATLYGFRHFYKDIKIAGVIFNFVSSASHYTYLCDACKDVGVEPLGYIPVQENIRVPSRHLGLNIDEQFRLDEFAEQVASVIEQHIDIDRLLEITRQEELFFADQQIAEQRHRKIAVALDSAFNFVYRENRARMEEWGEVIPFSPLQDETLPEADFVYLPGGYPELYLSRLSQNESMKESIRLFVEQGGKLWAECGGMMYLSSSITDQEGVEYPMVNLFPQKATMESMRLTLGYRQFEYKGRLWKGHEFHYSTIENPLESICQQYNAKGKSVPTRLWRYKNALAGYTHIYWGDMESIESLFQ